MSKKFLAIGLTLMITILMSISVCAIDPWDLDAMYGTPTIDAVIEEDWSYVEGHTWGDDDFGGEVKVMWDENYIYVLHVMNDDFPFFGDWVDTWFDMLANDNSSREDDDVSFSIGPEGDSISYEEKWREILDSPGMVATIKLEKGFIIELKYPFYEGYITPEAGITIGFTVSGSDDDDGDGVRENPVMASDGNYWDDPSELMDLHFVESMIPSNDLPTSPDASNVWLYIVIAAVVVVAILVVVIIMKKTKNSQ